MSPGIFTPAGSGSPAGPGNNPECTPMNASDPIKLVSEGLKTSVLQVRDLWSRGAKAFCRSFFEKNQNYSKNALKKLES